MVKPVHVVIAVLLLIPLIALLDIPSYNSVKPSLGGISFFYWYQLLWMPIAAILYYIASVLWNNLERDEPVADAKQRRRRVKRK